MFGEQFKLFILGGCLSCTGFQILKTFFQKPVKSSSDVLPIRNSPYQIIPWLLELFVCFPIYFYINGTLLYFDESARFQNGWITCIIPNFINETLFRGCLRDLFGETGSLILYTLLPSNSFTVQNMLSRFVVGTCRLISRRNSSLWKLVWVSSTIDFFVYVMVMTR